MPTKHKLGNWCLSPKGYPRFCSGKYRNKYVHRVMVSLKLKRKLKKDEDVHHKDGNKLNFKLNNLKVLSHTEHGYVSAKQHFYVTKIIGGRERKAYELYYGKEYFNQGRYAKM